MREGYLNPRLFGLPSTVLLSLKAELTKEKYAEMDQRPFLDAAFVSLYCHQGCKAIELSTTHHELYRQYLSDDIATRAIEYETNVENLAKCADYGVDSEEEQICDHVIQLAGASVLDSIAFDSCKMDDKGSDILLLGRHAYSRERRTTVMDYVQQAVKCFRICGHTQACMLEIELTPCRRDAAALFRYFKPYTKAMTDVEACRAIKDRLRPSLFFTSDKAFLFTYIKNHTVLGGTEGELREMYRHLLSL